MDMNAQLNAQFIVDLMKCIAMVEEIITVVIIRRFVGQLKEV